MKRGKITLLVVWLKREEGQLFYFNTLIILEFKTQGYFNQCVQNIGGEPNSISKDFTPLHSTPSPPKK